MKLLILGQDGRVHALTWKLLNSPTASEIVCAPGNGGTAPLAPVAGLDAMRPVDIAQWCFEEGFDLIMPTSMAPLQQGLSNEALSLQVGVCGAPAHTVALAYSRCRIKEFMQRYGLPTAPGRALRDLATAEKFLATHPMPVMIKTDHPHGGEQVYTDRYAALEGVRTLFATRPLEEPDGGVVIESMLHGPRITISAFCDGRTVVPLLPVRLYDHIGDGDTGPVAVGVGAHTSVSTYARQLGEYLQRKFLLPLVAGLQQEGLPCWGVVGIDCIVTNDGPHMIALRFAMREGEAQVVLPRLEDDLIPWIQAMISQRLHELPPLRWSQTASLGLGLFAQGYPISFPYGGLIHGFEELDDGVVVFQSETANPAMETPYMARHQRGADWSRMLGPMLGMRGLRGSSGLHTTGGLVVTLVAQGATLAGARGRALVNAERIQFEGRSFRQDIGAKEFG